MSVKFLDFIIISEFESIMVISLFALLAPHLNFALVPVRSFLFRLVNLRQYLNVCKYLLYHLNGDS